MKHLDDQDALRGYIDTLGPFDLCIWDFDGVICDSEPVQAASYRRLLERRDIHPRTEFFNALVGLPEPEIWRRISSEYDLSYDDGLLRERDELLRPQLIEDTPPNWFVRPGLEQLGSSGTESIIVSSGNLEVIESYLTAWGLEAAFAAVSALGNADALKAERLEAILESRTRRVLVLEDAETYLALCRDSGAITIGVAHEFNRDTLASCHALLTTV